MPHSLSSALDVARDAARDAAHLCLAVMGDAETGAMAKAGDEPVTIADYGSQAVALRRIATAFPRDRIVSEEASGHLVGAAGDEGAARLVALVNAVTGGSDTIDTVCEWIDHEGGPGPRTWAIDPIDGTKGFLRGDHFAVAIGILEEDEVVGGVLACPRLESDGYFGVLLWAGRGLGAHIEPIGRGDTRPAAVSLVDIPEGARMLGSVESAHGDPALVEAVISEAALSGGWVRLDSQVKYAAVADGAAEVYLRPRNRPDYRERVWDHAAGVAVVTEAGGRVTDLDGRTLDFSHGAHLEENRGVLATNGRLHDRVLTAIAAVESR